MKATRQRRSVPLGDTDRFEPTPSQPVRCRATAMGLDTQFEPHEHAWGQLAYCASGLLQVTVWDGPGSQPGAPHTETTTIVPPSRAVWIPPGARHAVSMLEAAQLLTLYVHAASVPPEGLRSRVIVVSPLLRELALAMDQAQHLEQPAHQQALAALVLAEMGHATTQPLGLPMPDRKTSDRRLRAVCEAVLLAPTEHKTLAGWARSSGASERTLARLFRDQLGCSFQRWRQQVLLAHALPMLARGAAVGQVAAASGYASDSAFCAMFKSALGQSPTQFGAGK